MDLLLEEDLDFLKPGPDGERRNGDRSSLREGSDVAVEAVEAREGAVGQVLAAV